MIPVSVRREGLFAGIPEQENRPADGEDRLFEIETRQGGQDGFFEGVRFAFGPDQSFVGAGEASGAVVHENDIALMEDGVVELGKEGSLLLGGIAGLGGLLEAFGRGMDIASAVDETAFNR